MSERTAYDWIDDIERMQGGPNGPTIRLRACVLEMQADKDGATAGAATIDRLHDRLRQIGDRAHDASTGPAVPDVLWEIRGMAYDGIGA